MSSLRIKNNVPALNSARQVDLHDRELIRNLERLSSGERINRAADDPAGLVFSEQMRSQIASLNQAARNSELAATLVQTTEASLGEINDLLVRIRQLAVHASNRGGTDEKAVLADQIEIDNAIETIQRLASETRFGNRYLLDGSTSVSAFGTGDNLEVVQTSNATDSSPSMATRCASMRFRRGRPSWAKPRSKRLH